MIKENFIWECIKHGSCEVNIFSLIIMEPSSSKVNHFIANVRNVGAFEAVDFISVRNGCTSTEMSDIVGILSVNIYLSLSFRIELFGSNQSVFE